MAILGVVGTVVLTAYSFLNKVLLHILCTTPIKWQIVDHVIVATYIFSLITFFVLLDRRFLYKKTLKQAETTPSTGENTDSAYPPFPYEKIPEILDKSLFSDKPSSLEIRSDVDRHPPFQQDAIIKSYVNLRIHWILALEHILKNNDSSIVEICFLNRIDGVIDINEHPEIKIAPKNTLFEVWAEITDMRYPRIFLGIHHLKLYEET
ncbi:MAG: hypothetical protein V1799_11395 [bacterium]